MATLATLTAAAQRALADTAGGTWATATVQAWVWEAIQDYSNYFHRTQTTTINCAAADHTYDLPADFLEILLVEYPTGQDPPEYLTRLPRLDPKWWLNDNYYDIEPSDQSSDVDAVLWISASPTVGQTITLHYRAHYYNIGDGSPSALIYVPEPHHPIIIQFVVWRAATERYAYAIQQPDSTSVILNQLSQGAERQRTIYDKTVKQAAAQRARGGPLPAWRSDAHDPIY